jgi:hypothetical protein
MTKNSKFETRVKTFTMIEEECPSSLSAAVAVFIF